MKYIGNNTVVECAHLNFKKWRRFHVTSREFSAHKVSGSWLFFIQTNSRFFVLKNLCKEINDWKQASLYILYIWWYICNSQTASLVCKIWCFCLCLLSNTLAWQEPWQELVLVSMVWLNYLVHHHACCIQWWFGFGLFLFRFNFIDIVPHPSNSWTDWLFGNVPSQSLYMFLATLICLHLSDLELNINITTLPASTNHISGNVVRFRILTLPKTGTSINRSERPLLPERDRPEMERLGIWNPGCFIKKQLESIKKHLY